MAGNSISRLQQVLTFTNVGAGGTATLPHLINYLGVPQIPSRVWVDNGEFSVTSLTASQVEVTNNGGAPGTVRVWLELLHSEIRAFGAETPYQGFIAAAGGSGGGGGGSGSCCLIYRPGSGEAGPVVFDDWGDLMTQLTTLRTAANNSGCYTIQFDGADNGGVCSIPAGTYDMTDVTWEGVPDGFGVFVILEDDTSFPGLRTVTRYIAIENQNTTTAPVADIANGTFIEVTGGSDITSTGGVAMFDASGVAADETFFIRLSDRSTFGFYGPGPVVSSLNGGELVLTQNDFSTAVATTLVGDGPLQIATPSMARVADNYPNWTGLVRSPQIDAPMTLLPAPYLTMPSAVAVSTFAGQWARLASATVINQTLPAITNASGGFSSPGGFFLCSNDGVGIVTLSPAIGDTVNGGLTAVTVGPSSTVLLVGDGISDWKVVATSSPGQGLVQSFRYTHAGGAVSDFFITLPFARPDDSYNVQITCAGVAAIVGIDCPDIAAGDRTTTQFRVVTSANLTDGDQFDVLVTER